MRRVLFLPILCIASLVHVSVSSARGKEWTIVTSSHDTLHSCVIGKLDGDVCDFTCDDSLIEIPLDSLATLSRHKESHFWRGAGYGALAGAVAGAVLGAAMYQESTGSVVHFGRGVGALAGASAGVVLGFAVGGIIGGASGGDETYDFSGKTVNQKIHLLEYIQNEDR
jgi:hypothetical protein